MTSQIRFKSDVELEALTQEMRRETFEMIMNAGGGHIAPSFSVAEILTVLYFGIMNYDPLNPKWEERDRFVLSKGHASAILYAVLAHAGFFPRQFLSTYCRPGSVLGGHPKMDDIPGVEASTGALGHGFPFAVGIALAAQLDKRPFRVFTVLGDGECQEGSVWEAALFAAQRRLGHLTVIVDYNKLQALDKLENIIGMEPFAAKWQSFGWDVEEVDGHNVAELRRCLQKEPARNEKPHLLIAHTTKGKGVSFMENKPLWHYRLPNEQETVIAGEELNIPENRRIIR